MKHKQHASKSKLSRQAIKSHVIDLHKMSPQLTPTNATTKGTIGIDIGLRIGNLKSTLITYAQTGDFC